MRPILIKDFLPNNIYNELNSNSKISYDIATDEVDPTYKLKRFHFTKYNKELHDLVFKALTESMYSTFSYQFTQYEHKMDSSYVYRDKESDFDPNYHSDMKGGKFNGNFMNAIIYFREPQEWYGGEFGYKDYNLEPLIRVHDNECLIIPAGLPHKIYPVTSGIRRSINLEFRIVL